MRETTVHYSCTETGTGTDRDRCVVFVGQWQCARNPWRDSHVKYSICGVYCKGYMAILLVVLL